MKRRLLVITLAFTVAVLTSNAAFASELESDRSPNSMAFPKHRLTDDNGDVLSEYPDYLRFVLDVGRNSDPRLAKALERTYDRLRGADSALAARFLRGLRFELVQRAELRGLPLKTLNNDHPQMRGWIAKYMRQWLREADEYYFRAYVTKRARKA